MYMGVVLTCVVVFYISLGPAVSVRVCPGGFIEFSLCNRITIAFCGERTFCILHIRWHCVSCRIKDIVCICPEHLYVFAVARVGMRFVDKIYPCVFWLWCLIKCGFVPYYA